MIKLVMIFTLYLALCLLAGCSSSNSMPFKAYDNYMNSACKVGKLNIKEGERYVSFKCKYVL